MISHTIASLMNNKTKLKYEKLNYFFVYFYILFILSYISLIGIMIAYIINQTKYFFFLKY